MPYALRIDDEMLALFLPPARAYLAGVTTTKRPTPRGGGDAAAGFDFGDAARMAAEFAPILGGAPATPAGQRGH